MDTTVDLLQIKINKAREELSEESRRALDAVDWKTIILGMRAEKGYSYTQLENLELETELLLCGLINPEDYPKEIEKRMGIPKANIDELVNEMNEKVFKKIREELVKNVERKKTPENRQPVSEPEKQSLETSSEIAHADEKPMEGREELLRKIEHPDLLKQKELPAGNPMEPKEQTPKASPVNIPKDTILGDIALGDKKETPSILTQKLSGSFQIPTVQTDHSLNNLSQNNIPNSTPKVDPYRETLD